MLQAQLLVVKTAATVAWDITLYDLVHRKEEMAVCFDIPWDGVCKTFTHRNPGFLGGMPTKNSGPKTFTQLPGISVSTLPHHFTRPTPPKKNSQKYRIFYFGGSMRSDQRKENTFVTRPRFARAYISAAVMNDESSSKVSIPTPRQLLPEVCSQPIKTSNRWAVHYFPRL